MTADFLDASPTDLIKRCISEATCRKMGYGVATDSRGRTVQVANYRGQNGQLVAQKVRGADKAFHIIGSAKDMGLFGAHLWKEGGRRVVVTEGEIDCLSVAQVTNCSWPVVSIPNGAAAARKAISQSLSFLESFESVVLCFDSDEPGREAAAECAPLFSPGKVSICELPFKDASAMLMAGEGAALGKALWQARVWRPGGIVNAADLWDRITEQHQPGIEYPWARLQKLSYGQRKGTLVTWAAGSGVGKSTILSQVAYDLAFRHNLKVGYVALEESVGHAAQRFLSQHLGKLCHLPGQATDAEMRRAFDETLASGRIWLFDHFGSADSDTLLSKLRYLAVSCECDALVLDHLSIAVSGMGVEGDERRVIDYTMTALRTLVEETGVLMHVISHLRRAPNDAKSAEEGGRVTLSMLRGSHSIAQLSDQVIAVERDLQGSDGKMHLRLLKNRLSGDTGLAGVLEYDKGTGRLTEVDDLGFAEETGDSDGPGF